MKRSTPFVLVLALAGCGGGGDTGDSKDEPAEVAPSTRNDLQWKRAWAVQRDLQNALELSEEELCRELGQFDCVREVHLVSLGGHDAIESAIYESLPEPLATTPIAVDRLVLSACTHRVDADASGDAKVFTSLKLGGDAPSATDPAVEKTIETLYRRLLARDPKPSEVETVSTLVVDDDGDAVSATDFAKLACYAVGSSTEFLFI